MKRSWIVWVGVVLIIGVATCTLVWSGGEPNQSASYPARITKVGLHDYGAVSVYECQYNGHLYVIFTGGGSLNTRGIFVIEQK